MGVRDRVGDRLGGDNDAPELAPVSLRRGPAIERHAVHKLHDAPEPPVAQLARAEDADDPRVIQARGQLDLTLEAVAGGRPALGAADRHLDRDLTLGALLHRPVNRALTPVGEQPEHPVARDLDEARLGLSGRRCVFRAGAEALEKPVRPAHLRQPVAAAFARSEVRLGIPARVVPRIARDPVHRLEVEAAPVPIEP